MNLVSQNSIIAFNCLKYNFLIDLLFLIFVIFNPMGYIGDGKTIYWVSIVILGFLISLIITLVGIYFGVTGFKEGDRTNKSKLVLVGSVLQLIFVLFFLAFFTMSLIS